MMENVIDWALVSGGVTIAAWIITFGYMKLLGRPKPSENILKAIVFGGAAVGAYFFTPLQLPVLGDSPPDFALEFLASLTLVFKTAQKIYDFALQRLIGAIGLG